MIILKSKRPKVEVLGRYLLPVLFYLALLVFLTLRPQSELPEIDLPYIDKLVHFFLFLGLSFLISRFLYMGLGRERLWKIYVCSSLLSVLYGALDEFYLQTIAEGRQTEFWDYLLNVTGSLSGPALLPLYKKIRDRFLNSR
jgi:VanZ family protein